MRQKTIGVTEAERKRLDKLKAEYEKAIGEPCDWGRYLTEAARLAKAAVEIGYRVSHREVLFRR